ncbi:MAG: roadblock/LC7 domain-containing protein [ANME-2 cluster archaeon]|nr:roadblock/LC7 domain-containing protein [ANME-2 cluster archaeon]
MSEQLSERLYNLLDEYCANVDGVVGIGISTPDGLEMSSHFNRKVNIKLAHAVSSVIYRYTRDMARRLDYTGFRYNLTYTENGIIGLRKLDANSLILVLVEPNADVNNILVKMDTIITRIKKSISE